MTGSEKRFWILFALLNYLLFSPAYLVNTDTSTFLPVNSFITHGPWYEIIKSFFKRDNYDIFRLSVDLTILVVIFYIFRKKLKIKKYSLIASGYYLLILIFLIYYHLMYKLFLVEPVLFNDVFLLKLGFQNIGHRSIFIAFILILVILLLYLLLFFLFSKLLKLVENVVFGRISKFIIYTTGFLLLFNFGKSGITLNANHVFQIAGAKVVDNLQLSSETALNIAHLNVTEINKKSAEYKSFSLATYPDIYLLFIESYGKILYQDSNFIKLYAACNMECERILEERDWYMASNFSLSPISGGGSWISFSSVMFGFDFHNQGTYLSLLRNTEIQNYTNIFRYFQSQGYKSYWVNPMPDNIKMEIPWKLYTDFYGIDKWITYNDIDYRGQLFGFGPSPPDQYSIFKAQQIIEKDTGIPRIVFYITHNSHNPFFCPDSIVDDWHKLNSEYYMPDPPSMFIKRPKAPDYIKSINYELQTITRFISETNNRNAIFILIGDHQPPALTTKQNGFETPVHIIASDRTFINSFLHYGFLNGMYVDNNARGIRHEAIYSMFMRELIRRYGIQNNNLPEYMPVGIKTK